MTDTSTASRGAVTERKALSVLSGVVGSEEALNHLRDIVKDHAQRRGVKGAIAYYLAPIEVHPDMPPAIEVTVSLDVDLDTGQIARLWRDIDKAFGAYLDELSDEQRLELNLLIGFRVTRADTVV